MRITRVVFRSSIQITTFQHAHIEAEAFIEQHENPSEVLEQLKGFVIEELKIAKKGLEDGLGRVPRLNRRLKA